MSKSIRKIELIEARKRYYMLVLEEIKLVYQDNKLVKNIDNVIIKLNKVHRKHQKKYSELYLELINKGE
jgi:hypothetical protein